MVDLTTFYAGVPEMLQALRLGGLRLGIVTTKYRRRINTLLKREGLESLVDVIVGGDEVDRPKPHPEGLIKALELLGTGAAEAVYVGDSVVDGETARAAGTRFVGVLTGTTTEAELRRWQPYTVLNVVTELTVTCPRSSSQLK
jgi:phosphoglycolate phosphatase